MGRSAAQNKYIHDLARTIAGQLGVTRHVSPLFDPASTKFGGQILYRFGPNIASKLQSYSPETLGKIAACGLGYDSGAQFGLCHVRDSSDRINWDHSGHDLLLMVATTAVVAAIADNIRAEHQNTPLARATPLKNPGPAWVGGVGSSGRQIVGQTLDQIEGERFAED